MMMPGKRKALADLVVKSGLFRLGVEARRLSGRSDLTVFNFHRIRDAGPARDVAFDEDVYGVDAEAFRLQMRWLRDNVALVSESDLLASLRGTLRLPASSVMVTFDDGYEDNFRLALPVLTEFKIPAIYFIPTQSIDERSLGWWDLIAYLLAQSAKSEITLRGHIIRIGALERIAAKRQLQQIMKLSHEAESRDLLLELSAACCVSLPGPEVSGRELMTWEQVREAAARGIAIGAHTHSQRVLATLDLETQRQEMLGSKQMLEAQIGRPVRTIAYPVGGYEHFNVETKRLARECGFEAAFSFHTGVNEIGAGSTLDAFDIKRLSAPDDLSVYGATLVLPSVYGRRRCEAREPSTRGQMGAG